jgi:hypothetical protein
MIESGPLAVWLADGVPSAKGISFEDQGGGLWKADFEIGRRDMAVTVWKVQPKE